MALALMAECLPKLQDESSYSIQMASESIPNRVKRSEAVRKRRKKRKDLSGVTDEELYRYYQLRAFFRYVFYQPRPDE